MKIRALIYIVLTATLAACSKENHGGEEQDGYGNVILNVSTRTMSRSGAQDGDAMNALRVWIADGSGKIQYCQFLTPDQEATSMEIEFKDVKRGVYTLYAAANFTGLDTYTEGETINEAFTKRVLGTIEDGSAPDFSKDGMPLSTVKSISVGPGDNLISASLKRCVGKISITVRNNIAQQTAVYIAGVGLSRHNPSAGYLFPQDDGSIPSASQNVGFRDFKEDESAPELYKVSYGSPVQIYETYLHETGETAGPFTFNLFAAIYDSKVQPSEVKFKQVLENSESVRHFAGCEYEVPRVDRTISYIDKYGNSQTLKQISRNDHINIVVNIFYNRELGDFEYSVESWDKVENETTFD